MLLTACGGGGSPDGTAADKRSGARGGQPAPDAVAPEQGRPSGEEGKNRENGENGDAPEPGIAAPDYLSTFALDVDTASYGYARRTLGDGRLPNA
nr:von Willebrand factor type A domain-containing protein [Streptomyces sp. DSM 41633]